ncbi:radical SAM protein [Clostridium sp. Marseille-P299]|uniref:radical SAM protein n=1 Tax=Clostridium sp. Marseille-P299 TaxID=1805477 RepID=UPI0008377780|nr:radical SAM protein [Clostridium sp. Marseille-P299]
MSLYIKLFSTPNGKYIFDVNSNMMLPILESSFEYLQKLLSEEIQDDVCLPDELRELKENGYISSDSKVKEIKHSYTDFLPTFLERKLSKITLQLTQNCNFRCKYCIYSDTRNLGQRTHSPQIMEWETAKCAIDFIWEHAVDSNSVNIGLYGGEPLLEFHLLKQIVEYSEERFRGKALTFNMTSNGTLLNEDIILFLEKHNISLMISLDGPREVNDLNRVFADGRGSYDAVTKGISLVRKVAPDYAKNMQISMVMDPQLDFDCFNSVCIDGDEFDKLNIVSSIVDYTYDGQTLCFSEEYTWKYEYQRFLALLAHFGRFPDELVSPILKRSVGMVVKDNIKIDAPSALRYFDAPSGPCIPGQLRLFVNTYGKFFPCERVSETTPCMCIGSLEEGFNYENASAILNVGKITESACKNCWCFRYCTICAKKADDGTDKLSDIVKISNCDEVKRATINKLKHYLLFKEVPFYYSAEVRRIKSCEVSNQ